MMKILFLMENVPLGFDFTGASSLITSHLRVISLLDVPKEIFIVTVPTNENSAAPDLKQIPSAASISVRNVPFAAAGKIRSLFGSFPRFIAFNNRLGREKLLFPVVRPENVAHLQHVVDEFKPDVIWAEHLVPFLLASHVKFTGKFVYSHHDFAWKLQLIRRQKIKDRIMAWMLKKVQERALKKATWIVSGAENELAEAGSLAKASRTFFCPTLYPLKLTTQDYAPEPAFRLVHLGTLKATANKIGLKTLLGEILPSLKNAGVDCECWLVGDLEGADDELKQLMQQPEVRYKGYVEDLDGVLFPNDLHVIPYDQPTGTRTRLTLALNHQQVLVAHRSSVAGFSGLEDGSNCLLCEDSSDMVRKIGEIYRNEAKKREIAANGKKWYDKNFREEAYAQKLGKWLNVSP